MHRRQRTGIALACTIAVFLAIAPTALAGTIAYDIAPSAAYTIDNEQGIAKVVYSGCVTAGARQTIAFAMVTNASNDAAVDFKVIREEGENPASTFDPATVTLNKNTEQTFQVVLSFTLTAPTDQNTTFRFKLDPENGAGLGEGPGVLVNIPCVLAAPSAAGGLASAPGPDGQAHFVPTAGVLVASSSALARGVARCISTPRGVALRAGERTTLDVAVNMSDRGLQNALVRITLPGGRAVAHRTGTNGIARFTLRPTRSGRAIIQTDVCFGARRLAVAARRVAAAQAAARFTG
jgi:hypothetical protein